MCLRKKDSLPKNEFRKQRGGQERRQMESRISRQRQAGELYDRTGEILA